MSRYIPHKAKRDANESEITAALKQAGCTVQPLSAKGVPDLLVGFTDIETGQPCMILMEVKDGYNKLTDDQSKWHIWWIGRPVAIVRSIEDALKAIGRL